MVSTQEFSKKTIEERLLLLSSYRYTNSYLSSFLNNLDEEKFNINPTLYFENNFPTYSSPQQDFNTYRLLCVKTIEAIPAYKAYFGQIIKEKDLKNEKYSKDELFNALLSLKNKHQETSLVYNVIDEIYQYTSCELTPNKTARDHQHFLVGASLSF